MSPHKTLKKQIENDLQEYSNNTQRPVTRAAAAAAIAPPIPTATMILAKSEAAAAMAVATTLEAGLKESPASAKKKAAKYHGLKFTDDEKKFILIGVQEFKGQYPMWKKILTKYKNEFQEQRKPADLKDCYRNLVKKGVAEPIEPYAEKRKWTNAERQAVLDGVELFGVAAWAEIKKHYHDVLGSRTNVQIKDCWRTLVKLNKVDPSKNIDGGFCVDSPLISPSPKKKEQQKTRKATTTVPKPNFNVATKPLMDIPGSHLQV